jgi:hypothetical protein
MNEEEREALLKERLERLTAMEEEIRRRERALKHRENARKQVLLRLSPTLWDQIAAWAEEDFRSINGQIEYLLTEAVRRRGRTGEKNNETGKGL